LQHFSVFLKEKRMDIRQLKLDLINRISQCDDPAVLQAAASVLALGIEKVPEKGTSVQSFPFQKPVGKTKDLDADAQSLQRDMDEVFGG
jgi:hypothetical protein